MGNRHYYTKAKHKECIVEMRELIGDGATVDFCLLNAYKYAYRAGLKTKNKVEDLNKMQWYLNYAVDVIKEMNAFNRMMYARKYEIIKQAIVDM